VTSTFPMPAPITYPSSSSFAPPPQPTTGGIYNSGRAILPYSTSESPVTFPSATEIWSQTVNSAYGDLIDPNGLIDPLYLPQFEAPPSSGKPGASGQSMGEYGDVGARFLL
jgi:hypothetical protein